MEEKMLITVIIAVYNVEKYLDSCIESVINQSYKSLEIILVNDKSTDQSGKICDNWAKKDKRVKVIHKPKNEGVNMARATGFKQSRGEYITFLDSDDIFHSDNISKSLKTLLEAEADIIAYGYHEFSDSSQKKVLLKGEPKPSEFRIFRTKDEIARYAFFGDGNFPSVFRMTVWGKLYSRKIIKNVNWDLSNYRFYEDNFWIAQALLSAESLIILSDKLVNYRRNTPYGHVGVSLSGQLTGNTKNDQTIGYLEQVVLLYKLDLRLAKKYRISGLDERLKEKYYGEMAWRIDGLSRAGLLGAENNLKYIPEIWEWFRELSARQHAENVYLAAENKRLAAEIDSHMKIKRSARLLVGNIKRRIIYSHQGDDDRN